MFRHPRFYSSYSKVSAVPTTDTAFILARARRGCGPAKPQATPHPRIDPRGLDLSTIPILSPGVAVTERSKHIELNHRRRRPEEEVVLSEDIQTSEPGCIAVSVGVRVPSKRVSPASHRRTGGAPGHLYTRLGVLS